MNLAGSRRLTWLAFELVSTPHRAVETAERPTALASAGGLLFLGALFQKGSHPDPRIQLADPADPAIGAE